MRLLVSGARIWDDYDLLRDAIITKHVFLTEPLVIVHGACPLGADTMASRVAQEYGLEEERYPADWNKYGRAAGHIRNKLMVDTKPDYALVFIKGESRGTNNCLGHIQKAGIKHEVFRA